MSALDIAKESWGDELPDWVEALAIECARGSQARVAKALDRSPALISQVLRNKYPADLGPIEERFRGAFQDGKVDCPALGPLPTNLCQDWIVKARQFSPGNPQRTRMYRACNKCPRFRKDAEV